MPIPAKCSAQLRRLLQSHSITRPAVCNLNGGLGSSNETSATSIAEPRRPIYPNLPYSPYSSPVSSPRVRRKPLRETTRVNSTIQSDGEYVQLNQYKLEQAIGQVRTWYMILQSMSKHRTIVTLSVNLGITWTQGFIFLQISGWCIPEKFHIFSRCLRKNYLSVHAVGICTYSNSTQKFLWL